MLRKDVPLQQGKPVFSQSGNIKNTANITPVTPQPQVPIQSTMQSPNVRRSSRLFSNSYSVKVMENVDLVSSIKRNEIHEKITF